MGNTYTKCPYCDRPVDPDAEGVVYARKPESHPGFGQTVDWISDGHAAFFHPECPPEAIGYVPRDLPSPSSP